RLGDRRVADAVLAELLTQAARHAEDPADESYVLAHDEDARVALHLAVQGLVERLGHRELAPARRRRLAHLDVRGVDRRLHELDARLGARLRELDGAVELDLHALLELLESDRRDAPALDQVVPEACDRVALHPFALLLPRAVVGEVRAHRVAAPTVGHGLDERGPLAAPGARHGGADRLEDGVDVVAVHARAREVVARRARRDGRARGRPLGGGREGVL